MQLDGLEGKTNWLMILFPSHPPNPALFFQSFFPLSLDTVTREEFSYIVAHVCVGGLNSGAHESGSSLNILPKNVGDLDLEEFF